MTPTQILNHELFRALRHSGVFAEPAARLARKYKDADADHIMWAFRNHIAETHSISLAVWRLEQGQLLTSTQYVADTLNAMRREAGYMAEGEN